jgi:hypothetical protein
VLVGKHRLDAFELRRITYLKGPEGRVITGLPNLGSDQLLSEPVFETRGSPISPDVEGVDTEGLVAVADGSFWVGDGERIFRSLTTPSGAPLPEHPRTAPQQRLHRSKPRF